MFLSKQAHFHFYLMLTFSPQLSSNIHFIILSKAAGSDFYNPVNLSPSYFARLQQLIPLLRLLFSFRVQGCTHIGHHIFSIQLSASFQGSGACSCFFFFCFHFSSLIPLLVDVALIDQLLNKLALYVGFWFVCHSFPSLPFSFFSVMPF